MRKNILGETSLYQSIGKITRKWEDCGVVSDCEELVGGYSLEMMGLFQGNIF